MGQRHGEGQELVADGEEYSGEWLKGKRHGQGELFSDGLHYDGEWVHGRRHGQAYCLFRNGDMYEGQFEDDLMQGAGRMVLINGCQYEGSWAAGKMHGEGKMMYPNGDVYVGTWKEGKREGVGNYSSLNGSIYEGEFRNGKRHGRGLMASQVKGKSNFKTTTIPFSTIDGEVYEGEWKHGKKSGQGTLHMKGRLSYEGSFVNDLRDGHGKAWFKDGAVYEGQWHEGKMHGEGRMRSKTGKEVQGMWQEGICKTAHRIHQESEVNEEESTMDAFERGKARLMGSGTHSHGEDAHDASGTQLGEDDEGEEDYRSFTEDDYLTDNPSSVGQLHDIDEEEEDMPSFERSRDVGMEHEAHSNAPTSGRHPSSAESMHVGTEASDFLRDTHENTISVIPSDSMSSTRRDIGHQDRLPRITSPNPIQHVQPPLQEMPAIGSGNAPDRHDEMVDLTHKYGVPMRGGFDEDGHYIPPVNSSTLREWNQVNYLFTKNREKRSEAHKGASTYDFDAGRLPGYREGHNIKHALSNAPRKTQRMVAGPGEFSYKRWQAERKGT
mmetsp:Transcript_45779/g.71735  ORF Transcript_45779/g.71735 Transcript_45779/m.71735 type:complete len:550 (-) Transcript_45779:23-1672(-)